MAIDRDFEFIVYIAFACIPPVLAASCMASWSPKLVLLRPALFWRRRTTQKPKKMPMMRIEMATIARSAPPSPSPSPLALSVLDDIPAVVVVGVVVTVTVDVRGWAVDGLTVAAVGAPVVGVPVGADMVGDKVGGVVGQPESRMERAKW